MCTRIKKTNKKTQKISIPGVAFSTFHFGFKIRGKYLPLQNGGSNIIPAMAARQKQSLVLYKSE